MILVLEVLLHVLQVVGEQRRHLLERRRRLGLVLGLPNLTVLLALDDQISTKSKLIEKQIGAGFRANNKCLSCGLRNSCARSYCTPTSLPPPKIELCLKEGDTCAAQSIMFSILVARKTVSLLKAQLDFKG